RVDRDDRLAPEVMRRIRYPPAVRHARIGNPAQARRVSQRLRPRDRRKRTDKNGKQELVHCTNIGTLLCRIQPSGNSFNPSSSIRTHMKTISLVATTLGVALLLAAPLRAQAAPTVKCKDGSTSTVIGRGACENHGGVTKAD